MLRQSQELVLQWLSAKDQLQYRHRLLLVSSRRAPREGHDGGPPAPEWYTALHHHRHVNHPLQNPSSLESIWWDLRHLCKCRAACAHFGALLPALASCKAPRDHRRPFSARRCPNNPFVAKVSSQKLGLPSGLDKQLSPLPMVNQGHYPLVSGKARHCLR
ncbi:hypothetical protein IWX48DRAFT_616013 [Phyllosticta citricarpa]